MPRFTLDEMVDIEFNTQEAMWRAYESAPKELREMGLIAIPEPRKTRQQIESTIRAVVDHDRNFQPRGWMRSAGYGKCW